MSLIDPKSIQSCARRMFSQAAEKITIKLKRDLIIDVPNYCFTSEQNLMVNRVQWYNSVSQQSCIYGLGRAWHCDSKSQLNIIREFENSIQTPKLSLSLSLSLSHFLFLFLFLSLSLSPSLSLPPRSLLSPSASLAMADVVVVPDWVLNN